MTQDRLKRPRGLTIIVILWFLFGLISVYSGYQVAITDANLLPYLSNPSIPAWLKFGLPAELALAAVTLCIGLLEFAMIPGLWMGKSYSYKIALAVPILVSILYVLRAGLYASAPAELGLGSDVSAVLDFAGIGVILLAVSWDYLRRTNVKRFLGVTKNDVMDQGPPSVTQTELEGYENKKEKGSFRVNKGLSTGGTTQYSMLFLNDRILFAKIGGQSEYAGFGAVIGVIVFIEVFGKIFSDDLLGWGVAGALGGLVGYSAPNILSRLQPKKRETHKSPDEKSVDEILGSDKNNFQILYQDISRIEMKKASPSSPKVGSISIEGKRNETFGIATNQKYEECEKIVKNSLSDKVLSTN